LRLRKIDREFVTVELKKHRASIVLLTTVTVQNQTNATYPKIALVIVIFDTEWAAGSDQSEKQVGFS
jgi:hypothetical protein